MKVPTGSIQSLLPTPMRFLSRAGKFVAAIIAILIILAQNSYADGGSPLVFMTAGHLFFGNAIIGVVEGLILALVFRARILRCIWVMILANYASMIAGLLGLLSLGSVLENFITIDYLLFSMIALGLGSYLITVVLEWPFCYWALEAESRRRRRALIASTLVNAASYAILVPLYLSVSETSLITGVKVDHVANIAGGTKACVYYVADDGHTVSRIRLDGSNRQRVKTFNFSADIPAMTICSRAGIPCLAALVPEQSSGASQASWTPILDTIPGVTASCRPCDSIDFTYRPPNVDLRQPNHRNWEIYEAGSLWADNRETGQGISLSMETLAFHWAFQNLTVLPGDQVVCQLGKQIVLVDLSSCRIGLITRGVSPVVVLDGEL